MDQPRPAAPAAFCRPLLRAALFCCLTAFTLWALFSFLREGDGPFDGLCTFTIHRTIPRQRLGYTAPPPYDSSAGHFLPYHGELHGGRWLGYCRWDMPLWPDGEPSAAAAAPPPPLMIRNQIYGVAPELLLPFTALLWINWAARRLRSNHHRANYRRYREPEVCRKCGYDLRATPQRCPECGVPTQWTPSSI
jgi:hypothetical protein